LDATLASLERQLYRNFAATVLDADTDNSTLAITEIEKAWLLLIRAGDQLAKHALYWFACQALAQPDAALMYADDDALDEAGRHCAPRFKPDWSPEHLRSTNYIGAAAALRGREVVAAGGLKADDIVDGGYGLLLRVAELVEGRVAHVPAVLLHRWVSPPPEEAWEPKFDAVSGCERGSNADVLRSHLKQCRVVAEVVPIRLGKGREAELGCRVKYALPNVPLMVSLIVPTRDALALTRTCVESVLARSSYRYFEILIVDNQSTDPAALTWFDEIAQLPQVRVLRYDKKFSFSAINNYAVSQARGEVLCLLNNDTEVISPDWMEEMLGHLVQPGVGAVGAKLLYPDGRVQHAGDAVGPRGCADHLHEGIGRDDPGYCNRALVAHEVSAVTGACLMTWRGLYQELGGLDEVNLKVAFNDVDYCLRVQEAGQRVIFTPHAQLYHHESASRGQDNSWLKLRRTRREADYIRRRWKERLYHDPYYNPNLSYRAPDFSLSFAPRVKKPWVT